MNIADIIFLVFALFFVIRGYFKGFISEFLSLAALICGFAAGWLFKDAMAPMLSGFIKSATWRPVVAFFIIFIGTYVIVMIIKIFLNNIVTKIQMNSLDRILGVFWGVLEATVVILLLVFLIYSLKFEAGINFLKKSEIAHYALEFLKGMNMDQLKDVPLVGDMHV